MDDVDETKSAKHCDLPSLPVGHILLFFFLKGATCKTGKRRQSRGCAFLFLLTRNKSSAKNTRNTAVVSSSSQSFCSSFQAERPQ